MNRPALMTLAWVGATIVSMLIASAAVGAVRGRVSDEPQPITAATPLVAEDPVATTLSSTTTPQSTTTIPATASPTTTAPSSVTTTTTAPAIASTTTTTAPAAGVIKTYSMAGGTVSIEVFADHLALLGAVPSAGYTVAEKDLSARRIEIEFKSGEAELKFKAVLEDDGVHVETGSGGGDDEEEHGDD